MTTFLNFYNKINKINKTSIIKQLILLGIFLILINIIYKLNFNQFLKNIIFYNSSETIYNLLNNIYYWLNIIKDTLIAPIYAEELESYKVDILRLYYEDLYHVRLNTLCEFMRWDFIERAILGKDANMLVFFSNSNCRLSDVMFSVEGDILGREFSLINHWPDRGFPLAIKVEEGVSLRGILGLPKQQDFTYLVNAKALPAIPHENPQIHYIDPRSKSGLYTIYEEQTMDNRFLPESANNSLPRYEELNVIDTSRPRRNSLPGYGESTLNVLVADDSVVPNENLLARSVEGNSATRLANKLEYQLDWSNPRISSANTTTPVENTVRLSEID